MKTISVTQIINNFKKFDREFWLSYKALEQLMAPEAFEACKMKMLKSKKVDSTILSQVNLEEFELKRLEIDAEWRKENEEAKQQGTAIHDLIRTQLIGGNSIKSDFNVIGNLATDEFLNAQEGLFVENRLELPIEDFVIIGIPDLVKIEKKMMELSNKEFQVSHYDLTKEEAKKLMANDPYKLELIEGISDNITIFSQGNFTDLCAGPHLLNTDMIKHFKLTNVAGAYWRGNSNNKMLTRIYGTSFYSKEELDNHLNILEERKRREKIEAQEKKLLSLYILLCKTYTYQ